MTHVSEGWAFLVARGRRAVYRTVLAPAFLVDANLHHVLAESTGATGRSTARARVVELDDARVGPLTIGYMSERLALADLEAAGPDGGQMLTDEHGRPLEIIYGVVSRDRLEEPLDAEDLRTAREQALRSYRGFLADEKAHRVDVSAAFALRTRSCARTTSASVEHDRVATAPERTGRQLSPRPALRRTGLLGAVAVGVALVVAGLLIGLPHSSTTEQVVDPAWAAKSPSGAVHICSGTGVSGSQKKALRDYNDRFSGSKAAFDAGSSIADSQREYYLRLIEEGRGDCDVIYLDVAYMAEFAAKGLLYDMTPYLTPERRTEFDDRMVKTVQYDGRLWGVPKQLDVGLLYYRADRVRAPRSWQDVFRRARARGPTDLPGLRLQDQTYEGLTVVVLELAYSAGARPIVTNDGNTADIDQPAMHKALTFMRNAIRDRVIPRSRPTDAGTLDLYERGRARFLRAWSYVASRLSQDISTGTTPQTRRARRTTADNTRIVSLPPWRSGGESVGVLGGHDLVIPRSAHNPSAALRLIDFLTSTAQVRNDEREASQYPVLTAVANDLDLANPSLISAIKHTRLELRPPIPQYAKVSRIISRAVQAVLDRPTDDAFAREKLQQVERDAQSLLDRDPA